jgi:hypothetical protein
MYICIYTVYYIYISINLTRSVKIAILTTLKKSPGMFSASEDKKGGHLAQSKVRQLIPSLIPW